MVRAYFSNKVEPEVLALAAFAVAAIIFFSFAKAYTHPIFAVALAFTSRYLHRHAARGVGGTASASALPT